MACDGTLNGREGRHDNDANVGLPRQHFRQKVETGLGAKPKIEKHHLEMAAIERLERGSAGRHAQDAGARSL